MQKRWEMMKWVIPYIDENMDRWEKERLERDRNSREKMMDWKRKSRHEKIREFRETNTMNNYKPKIELSKPTLTTTDQAEHGQNSKFD